MVYGTGADKLRLSDSQIATFHREGYLMVEDVIPHDDLQPVIDEINATIDRMAREAYQRGEIPELYESLGFEKRLTALSRHSDDFRKGLLDSKLKGPAIFDLIRHPRLLDVAESLCGPELIASSVYRLRPKIPNHHKGAIPWHQDSGYFEPYCDKSLILTVWVPLLDADEDRGCMWVIPGSHLGNVVKHVPHGKGTGLLRIPEEMLPPGAKAVPVKKGGALLMTNRVMHASFDNTSDVVRWSMDLRYQSAALPTNSGISRLPDEVSGSAEAHVPDACYPPEADFLIRSRARPNEVVATAEQFRSLRENHSGGSITDRFGLHQFLASQNEQS